MTDKWKLILLGALIAVIALLFLRIIFTPKAEATQVQKYYICHVENPDEGGVNQQTLHLPLPGYLAHLFQHDADYPGVCQEPEDVCENLEGVQEETPEGMVNEQGNCYVPEEPKDYCDTLEGVQAEDEDCPREEEEEPTQPGTPPTFAGSSTNAPVCPDGNTSKVPANAHVVRNGGSATANFFITEGNSANIYWKVNESADWQHSASNVKPNSENFVSFTINDLVPALGYTFGVQQKSGCGGGQITAVVVDPPAQGVTFRVNYYQ